VETSTLLAIEAMRTSALPETDQALRTSLDLLAERILPALSSASLDVIAFSHKMHNAEHAWLAGGTSDGLVQVTETDTGAPIFRYKFQGAVLALSFSHDDRYFAVGTASGIAQIFATENGFCNTPPQKIRFCSITQQKYYGEIRAIAFSPTGDRLAIANGDYVRIFDSADAHRHRVVIRQPGKITALSFAPEGHFLASAGEYGASIFKDTSNAKTLRLRTAYRSSSIAFSPDGKLIATAGEDGIARVFDSHGRYELIRKEYEARIQSVVFSPDSQFVAIAGGDSTARVIDITTGDESALLQHQDFVNAVEFSEDGNWLATASSDHTARVFDWRAAREVARLPLDGPVTAICFGPHNRLAIVSESKRQLRAFQIINRDEVLRLPTTPSIRVQAIDLSSDYRLIATGSEDGILRVFDITDSSSWESSEHKGSVASVLFNSSNEWLTTGDGISVPQGQGNVRIFEVVSRKPIKIIPHENIVQALAFDSASQILATGTYGNSDISARVFDATKNFRNHFPPINHDWPINAVAVSPDGHFLATGDAEKCRIFRLSDRSTTECQMSPDKVAVLALSFSKDNKLLISGGDDSNIRIFDVETGKLQRVLPHDSAVVALTITDDGTLFASATRGGIVRIFDAAGGNQIGQIDNHMRNIKNIKFSKDGRRIRTAAIGSEAIFIREYWVRGQDLIEKACSYLQRNLTKKEWQEYLPNEAPRRTCPSLPDPQ